MRSSGGALSNCYIPPRTTPQHDLSIRDNGLGESRSGETLRRLCLDTSVLSRADGSSLVELGHTKVMASLTVETDSSMSIVEEGVLSVRVEYSAHFGMAPKAEVTGLDGFTGRRKQQTQAVDIEQLLHSALLPSLNLKLYPKYVLNLSLTILQDDGNVLSACCVASTLALADAQIELYDLVTCCQVVWSDDKLLVDPTTTESSLADASLTLAMLPSWKEVTLWQQSGFLNEGERALDLCREGCKTLHKFIKNHLVEKEGSRK